MFDFSPPLSCVKSEAVKNIMFLHSIMVTVAKIAEFLPYPNLGTHHSLQATAYILVLLV